MKECGWFNLDIKIIHEAFSVLDNFSRSKNIRSKYQIPLETNNEFFVLLLQCQINNYESSFLNFW